MDSPMSSTSAWSQTSSDVSRTSIESESGKRIYRSGSNSTASSELDMEEGSEEAPKVRRLYFVTLLLSCNTLN